MKLFATLAAVLLAASACEKQPSKLDGVARSMPKVTTSGGGGNTAALEARLDSLESRLDAMSKVSTEATGTPEERLRKVELNLAQYAEALDFLQKVYDQQKAQQEAQEAREPAPDAVFAVDISKNLEIGQFEGPKTGTYVTIVEAWDFA